ncbi:MAG: hypothetical protein HQL32_03035 [Planctomycetes bacterium]|nr:hypothetical protein [Planctomycetota bacterium]
MQAHFIPNTHLDREWSVDFQHSRKMTVDFLDNLLEVMAAIPEYSFLLDSQAMPLEDYLEVRPENKEVFSQYIQEGRLSAGPWYTALDMNCITGESVVRNMHWGHLSVEELGPVMKVGYTPFGWGQVSQLPQIYKGFGIEMAFFYRGITQEQAPKSEFVWRGADNTEILTSRFGSGARYNFYFDVWRKAFYTGMDERIGRRYHWKQDGIPFKLCDDDHRANHGYVIPEKKPIQQEVLRKSFRELIQKEKEIFGTNEIALMHGMDTSTPDLREADILQACQGELAEGEKLIYSSLPRYAEAVSKSVDWPELPRIEGEVRHVKLNDYGFSYIANDIISARTRQKALMAEAENKLIRQAEPHAVMGWLMGEEWPSPFLAIAWKQFLKCLPHDTVGGCGIDELELDATSRLRDVKSMANMISSESLLAVQTKIDTSSFGEDALVLTAYNTCPYTRTQCVEAYIDIPREMNLQEMAVVDHKGNPVKCSFKATNHTDKVFRDHSDLALMSYTDEYLVCFEAKDVPAMGYTTYSIKSTQSEPNTSICPGEFVLENGSIKVSVNEDGSVDIHNKLNGENFTGLNTFEDVGEVGHAWSHISSQGGAVTSKGQKASIQWLDYSDISQSIEVKLTLTIPQKTPLATDHFDWFQSQRPEGETEMPIKVVYQLKEHSEALSVSVSFENRCENHRLRAVFPSDISADMSYAESIFDVVERHNRKSKDNPYHEVPYLNYPFVRFAGLKTNKRNLTLICSGLKEYEVMDDERQSLALTLMRAYTNNLCTAGDFDLEHRPGPLAQSQGQHDFSYQIYTGHTDNSFNKLYQIADNESTPLLVTETKSSGGKLPPRWSFLELSNPHLILSAIKKAAKSDDLIVRIFNSSNEPQQGDLLILGHEVSSARFTNLHEEPTSESPAIVKLGDDSKINLALEAKKITTISLTL